MHVLQMYHSNPTNNDLEDDAFYEAYCSNSTSADSDGALPLKFYPRRTLSGPNSQVHVLDQLVDMNYSRRIDSHPRNIWPSAPRFWAVLPN